MNFPQPTLIGLPYDASSSYRQGPAGAPAVIRKAFHCDSTNYWSESLRDLSRLADEGDLSLPANSGARALIEQGIQRVMDQGGLAIALGGDHSVTYPILRAIHSHHPALTILHFDAHPDLYEDFEGDPFSHACPFARIMEDGLAQRLVQVGIRTMSGHQRAQADRFEVEVIDMRAWSAGVRPQLQGPLYVSIDMDAFDPAFAPGVSHLEPGGLTSREVITLLQNLPGPLVGADVVEFNPDKDSLGITAALCAKLVKELASRMLETTESA